MLRVECGEINAKSIQERQKRDLLDRYISENNCPVGHCIPAGRYIVAGVSANGKPQSNMFTLKMKVIYGGAFDPSSVTLQNQTTLNQFLDKANAKKLIRSGRHYIVTSNNKVEAINIYDLKYGMIAREVDDKITYYDVIDEGATGLVGSGFFGSVRRIVGTVKPEYCRKSRMIFSPSQDKRLMKLQSYQSGKHGRLATIKNEIQLMEAAQYFKVRDLQQHRTKNENISYISMRRFRGQTLYEILESDKRSLKPQTKANAHLPRTALTTNDRLALTIQIMRQIKIWLHDKNIIHRDIKPENIMAYKDKLTGHWEVRIIDLGLSIPANGNDHKSVGTPLYTAPEIYSGNYSDKSDLYSLMRMIASIWRDKNLDQELSMSEHDFYDMRMNQANIKFDMFAGINLNPDIKKDIEDAIKLATTYHADKRPTLASTIEVFEKIRLNFSLSVAQKEYRKDIIAANTVARDLLKMIAGGKIDSICNLQDYYKMLKSKINMIADNSPAALHFCEVLGYSCLSSCKTKSEIQTAVKQLIKSYVNANEKSHAAFSKLQILRGKASGLDISELDQYVTLCNRFMSSIKLCPRDLDSIAADAAHMQTKTAKMHAALIDHQEVVTAALRARTQVIRSGKH